MEVTGICPEHIATVTAARQETGSVVRARTGTVGTCYRRQKAESHKAGYNKAVSWLSDRRPAAGYGGGAHG